ncbi:hypothetical protein PG993_011883 [Apiospora rasikravindrae]|uniref:Secreted protein n=1 Tax=Apiospora rasikravindrae TaxID=990691 RepID=A0ABR1S0V4_9PEZI
MELRPWLAALSFLLFNLFLLVVLFRTRLGHVMLVLHLLHRSLDLCGKRVIQHLGVPTGTLQVLLGQSKDGVGEDFQLFARQGLVLLGALLGVALEELGQGLLDAQPGVLVLVPGAGFGVPRGVDIVVVVAVEGRLRLEVLGRQDGADGLLARVLGGVLLGVGFAFVGGAGLVL